MPTLINPVNAPRSQGFGELATAGVIANPNGTTVQQLVYSYGNYQPYGHDGIDYACPIGTPVYAMADGVVDFGGDGTYMPDQVALKWAFTTDPSAKWATGNAVLIDFGDDFGGYTAHMSEVYVRAGQRVGRGELIGRSGSTGRSGGPHCHASVVQFSRAYADGLYGRVNPDRFISAASVVPAGSVSATPSPKQLIPGVAGVYIN